MTDSVKIRLPPHDPIASTLSAADDRIVLSDWLPPQEGIVPSIRIGRRWISILWAIPIGAAALVLLVALAQSLRELLSVQAFIKEYRWYRASRALGRFRLSVVAAAAALPEHALHDVYHQRGDPDPGRSSAALLETGLYTWHGVVSFPA